MSTRQILSLAATALFVGLAAPAVAQEGECTTDADCSDGYVCETIEYGYCTDCAAPEPGGEPTDCVSECVEGSENVCVPPPPKQCSDTEPCDGDDVCVTYTFESCSGGGAVPTCPPEDPCPAPEPAEEPSCTSESESYCVPKYYAPCQQDSDCGAGFTCEDVEVCTCSGGVAPDEGGGGSTGSEGGTGDTEPAPVDDCTCEPAGEKYCQLIEQECTSDADCAQDLTCQDMGGETRPAIACAPGEDCPDVEPVDPVSYCAPPGYYYYGGGGGAREAVADATGHESGEVTSAEREEFFPVDGDDETGGGGSKGKPSTCAVGAGSEPAGSLLVLLLGLVAARIRRR